VALAQSSPGSAPKREAATEIKPSAQEHTIRGTVLGPDGKPAAQADVIWMASPESGLPHVALPRDHEARRGRPFEVLATTKTDPEGHFVLTPRHNPSEHAPFPGVEGFLLAVAPGAGICSKVLWSKEAKTQLSLRLPHEVVVRGRLLTPAGQPAAGVRVALDGFYNDAKQDEGMSVGRQDDDGTIPPHWPRPRKTDGDGRFVFENVPQGTYVNLSFRHPEHAVDEVTVNTTVDGAISPGLKGFEIVPVKPTFTHTLEPARPVQGRVTDKQTGKPLAGMLVEMVPMRRHGGMPFSTRTDADGRYRVSGHQADNTYFTTVYPRANSGYLTASDQRHEWPAGAKALEVNFALERGKLVSGRVIDQDTRQPIAGAAVVYQPARGNPNNKDRYDLRNTVLTDREGRFTITALPGEGFLAVETPDESYIRTPLKLAIRDETLYPQGHAAINVPKEGDFKPVDIALKKGVTLEARVLGPDGQVVSDLVAMYLGIDAKLIDVWNGGQEFPDGIFRIPGTDPGRTYRVFFTQPDRRLGAVAELKVDAAAPGPIEVRLQPTATVKGKLVNPGGSEPMGIQVYPLLVLKPDLKELKDADLFDHDLVQFYNAVLGQRHFHFYHEFDGCNGEFSFEALIPGARFYVVGAGSGREAYVPVDGLKPGEVRDLGTITMKERKP
jgi:5-hydroxyisourate hydrolase-like protein (transthyretin family)